MKKRFAVMIATILATMTLTLGASAHNAGPCGGDGPGNSGYAQHHIAFLAKQGKIGNSVNGVHVPGTAHQGFSLCLGVHD